LGIRGTGRSTILREHFSGNSLYLDLLNPALEDCLSPNPGDLFKHFLILEAFRFNSYYQRDFRMSHLRTKSGFEVDAVYVVG
jgi:hypothetical protein